MSTYIHTYIRHTHTHIWFVHSWVWNGFLKHTNICRPWGTYTVVRPFIHITLCKVKWKFLSHVQLFATPWTIARQAPPSMGFSRKKYWSGLPFPSPGILPDPEVEPGSPALQVDSLPSEPPGKPMTSCNCNINYCNFHCPKWTLSLRDEEPPPPPTTLAVTLLRAEVMALLGIRMNKLVNITTKRWTRI